MTQKLIEFSAYLVWLCIGILIGEASAGFTGAGSWPQILTLLGCGIVIGALVGSRGDSDSALTPEYFGEDAIQLIRDFSNDLRHTRRSDIFHYEQISRVRDRCELFLTRYTHGGES